MNQHELYAKLSPTHAILDDDAPFEQVGSILLKKLQKVVTPFNCSNDAYVGHKEAGKIAASTDHLGVKDWKLANRLELVYMTDLTRHSPAANQTFFPFIKPDWYWAEETLSAVSGLAWYVGFGHGYSSSLRRNGDGYVLAVRGAPSQ